jgi:tagatose 1,6-diphosphate aldolase GatY/KbaY
MPFESTKKMLESARKNNYAVCAFNAENLEMVQAIVWGAAEMKAPVIIQTTPSTVKYTDCGYFAAIARTAAENASVPVALHLDHGNSFDLVCRAIKAGYSSVMIDGSQLAFDENIEFTKKAADAAKAAGLPIEGELGKVGGKEDDLESANDNYTDPADAAAFVAETGIDSLAIGIGTAHGLYKIAPVLDLNRLTEIKKVISVPIVLHGATGLADDVIKECVSRGINKINFATELRLTYTNAVREKLASDDSIIDVKVYSDYARNAVKNLVKAKIALSGSMNKTV